MKLWARQLAFGLLLTAAIPSAAVRAADSAEQILLNKANFWRQQDRLDLARQALDKLLALNPNQPEALYQYAVLELQQGNRVGARAYLARLRRSVPADARLAALAAALNTGASGAQPATAPAAAPPAPSRASRSAALRNAIAADPQNPQRRLDYARFLASQGAAVQGFAIVDPAATGSTPASLETAAIYDSEQNRPADALAKLDRIPAASRSAEVARLRSDILLAATAQRATLLAGAGKTAEARGLLIAAFADPGLRPADRAGIPHLLAALDGDGLALSGGSVPPPADPAAATLAAAAGGSAPVADLPAPLDTTASYADSADLAPAPTAVQLASLQTGYLSDSDVEPDAPQPAAPAPAPQPVVPGLAQAVDTPTKPREQLAQAELVIPPPIGGYQPPIQAGPVPQQDSLELDIERSMAAIEAETSPVLEAGLVYRGRIGQSGLSQLNEVALPIDGTFSPFLTGTMEVQVAPIYLNAGTAGGTNLALFGANPILFAGGAPLVTAGQQSAGGVMTAVGYSFGPFSGKVGNVAWGFPVDHVTGDVAFQPKFLNDTLSFRLEGLRQPVTDSLLSYAGTHASLGAANAATGGAFGTNGTWGGVVKSGGRGSVFFDNNNIGAFGTVGFAALTGRQVPENDTVEAVAGAYFRPYRGDNDALRIGVNLAYFGFNKNLSYYTFGQGGYFSPQNYEAITFPVEYQGRTGQWSYLGAVALGVQHFNEDQSDYFPEDPAAQAALVALAGQAGAVYPSRTTTGLAADIRAQVEYAVADDLAIGVAGSYDNGHSYNEGVIKLYVRKTFSDPPQVTAILPGSPMMRP